MKRLCLALLLAACGSSDMATGADASTGGVTASFASLYGDYFNKCKSCHAPGAPGFMPGTTETSLDFSSASTGYTSVKTKMAMGLSGNSAGCNGVPFIAATPGQSLIVAVLDQPTRNAFDLAAYPNCDMDAITDQGQLKLGTGPSTEFIAALKDWITAGAPNN